MTQHTNKTINQTGLDEIKAFLAKNHKHGKSLDLEMLYAWASDAEYQISIGNPPCIELKAWQSVSGAAIEFQVSESGIDTEVFNDE